MFEAITPPTLTALLAMALIPGAILTPALATSLTVPRMPLHVV